MKLKYYTSFYHSYDQNDPSSGEYFKLSFLPTHHAIAVSIETLSDDFYIPIGISVVYSQQFDGNTSIDTISKHIQNFFIERGMKLALGQLTDKYG